MQAYEHDRADNPLDQYLIACKAKFLGSANGLTVAVQTRLTRPHALVMLKLLALGDRYRNFRGAA